MVEVSQLSKVLKLSASDWFFNPISWDKGEKKGGGLVRILPGIYRGLLFRGTGWLGIESYHDDPPCFVRRLGSLE